MALREGVPDESGQPVREHRVTAVPIQPQRAALRSSPVAGVLSGEFYVCHQARSRPAEFVLSASAEWEGYMSSRITPPSRTHAGLELVRYLNCCFLLGRQEHAFGGQVGV